MSRILSSGSSPPIARVVRLACLLLILALLALAATVSAQAGWSPPVTLSGAGQAAGEPQVAMDSNGNAVFAWARSDGTTGCGGSGCSRIQTRVRSASGALSSIQTVSAAGQNAFDPQVAVDSNGKAVFAWGVTSDGTTDCGGAGCSRIQARARSAAGALSVVQTLSAAGQSASEPQAAVDPNGNAVFAWQRPDGTADCGGFACTRIEARARSAAGSLSAIQTLSDPGQSAGEPSVAVDQNGGAVVVWQRPDGTTGCGGAGCSRIQVRARSAAGALSATQTLSAAGRSAGEPTVAVDPSGNAVALWSRPDGTGCGGSGCFRIQARARSAAGALSAPQTLSAVDQNAFDPQSAMDPSGRAITGWVRSDGSTGCGGSGCPRVQARVRTAAGALSGTQTLSAAGQGAGEPKLAVDANGNAVFVWQRADATTDCGGSGCSRLEARVRLAGGALSVTQALSDPGQSASDPGVAVDPTGNAAAVWSRSDGTTGCGGFGCLRVQAATGLTAPGPLTQLSGTAGCISQDGSGGTCGSSNGLVGPYALTVSGDGTTVYVAAHDSDAVVALTRNTATGELSQLSAPGGCISNGGVSPPPCSSGKALDQPVSVAVSPDGTSVYVASELSDAVAVFSRDTTTGELTQLAATAGCVSETGSGGQCADGKALDQPDSVAVSPDGKNVYVASDLSNAVAVFSRNATTGALTQPSGTAGCISDGGSGGTCTSGQGLGAAFSLAVSADGKNVYVAANGSNAVAVLTRNTTTGQLTQPAFPNGCVSETAGACTDGKGLEGPRSVAASSDGKSVYVASARTFADGAVAVFKRNATNGTLTQLAGTAGCVSESGSGGECADGKALALATSAAVSADRESVYIASYASNAVAAFRRNTTSGALTQLFGTAGCVSEDGSGGQCSDGRALDRPYAVAISPNGKNLYAASFGSAAVAVFARGL